MASACLTLWLVTGCGPAPKPTGTLQGKLTLDSAPVKDAKIQIHHSTSGESAVAVVSGDGSFTFPQPVGIGDYKVCVIPVFEAPVAGADGGKPIPVKPPERKDIPDKYRQTTSSGLTTSVKAGENTFNVEMKK